VGEENTLRRARAGEATAVYGVGTSSTVSRVGENFPPIGPAPAQMSAPCAFLFAFHCSLMVYAVPAARGRTVCTKAALGEKVPANPPDSFHASGCPAVEG
jgi:hypothetical protein